MRKHWDLDVSRDDGVGICGARIQESCDHFFFF